MKISGILAQSEKVSMDTFTLLHAVLQNKDYDTYADFIDYLIPYVDEPAKINIIMSTLRLAYLHRKDIRNWKELVDKFELALITQGLPAAKLLLGLLKEKK